MKTNITTTITSNPLDDFKTINSNDAKNIYGF